MKTNFIPIDYDYFDLNGRNFVRIIGRDESGKRICVVDEYNPNFWAILKDGLSEKKIKSLVEKIKKIEVESGGRKSKVEKVEIHDKNFLGKKVKALKIFVTNHKDMHAVADKLKIKEIEKRREYDIPLISKYIIEKNVDPLVWHEVIGDYIGSGEFGGIADVLKVDVCIKANKISKAKEQKEFNPRILAYDIEANELELGKGKVLMISLYGKNFSKVLTWKYDGKKQDFVEYFKDEAEMLEKFVEYVHEYSPDILVGYFSDGFDLPYLQSAAARNKIKLSLGLDQKPPTFTHGRISSGKISGIVHIDLFRFIKTVYAQYLQSETLGLGEVAAELCGEKKLEFDFAKIGKMNGSDWKKFFEYNLMDAKITYKLAEKIWPDMLEFTRIIKEPLFGISRDSMSSHVENYLLHNLNRFNEIAEKRPTHDEIRRRRSLGKYEGAFVLQPTPGLYENLVMFDFSSMYASVIVTYNLSLSTFLGEGKDEKGNKTLKFSKKKGFFPELLEEIIYLRRKYKEEYKKDKNPLTKARSNAYKLLANTAYGYQGFFGARYYCREAAMATSAFAKKNILEVIEKIKKEGYEIVYSDTDSIAFLRKNRSKEEVLNFLKKLNKSLPGIMELDLEDFYKRGLFVSKRTTEAGAKKKYALISENGKLKVRGFETVRRDWCNLARNLQKKVLEKILREGNEKSALKIVKEVIKKIKTRQVNKEDLIIKTQLKKPIEEYLSQGPHVIAAKKMEMRGLPISVGMLVEYFVGETNKKGGRIRDKVFLPDENVPYEIDYYLNNQILPAVENIFEVFNIKLKDIINGYSQKKLFT